MKHLQFLFRAQEITQEESVTINIPEESFDLSYTLVVTPDDDDLCDQGIITLIANTDTSINSYSWSNGGDTQSIEVTEGGEYIVTTVSICDIEQSSSIVISDDDFDLNYNLTIDTSEMNLCEEGLYTLTANANASIVSYSWSNGQTTPSITVPSDGGEYSVTVVDDCDVEQTETITLGAFSEFIRWPNLFFPESNISDLNQTFGPHAECPNLISGEYKLEIFNRWGDKLYQSDRIIDRWNGRKDNQGRIVQEDVYMYVWSLGEITGSGHVTLARN